MAVGADGFFKKELVGRIMLVHEEAVWEIEADAAERIARGTYCWSLFSTKSRKRSVTATSSADTIGLPVSGTFVSFAAPSGSLTADPSGSLTVDEFNPPTTPVFWSGLN
jgi:hypothetical protein